MTDVMIGIMLFVFFGFLIYMTGVNEYLACRSLMKCNEHTVDDNIMYTVDEVPVQFDEESTSTVEVQFTYSNTTDEDV